MLLLDESLASFVQKIAFCNGPTRNHAMLASRLEYEHAAAIEPTFVGAIHAIQSASALSMPSQSFPLSLGQLRHLEYEALTPARIFS